MPTRFPCTTCGRHDDVPLPHVSKDSWVDYFRCEFCGHVWVSPKPGERGQTRDVTLPREPEERA